MIKKLNIYEIYTMKKFSFNSIIIDLIFVVFLLLLINHVYGWDLGITKSKFYTEYILKKNN
tara:strand:+ start:37101 stop:37283 length:183 start_codon:yes stop_codon:yes gene_type:complete